MTYTLAFLTAPVQAQSHMLVSPIRPGYAPIFDALSYIVFAVEMVGAYALMWYIVNWLDKKTEVQQYENS